MRKLILLWCMIFGVVEGYSQIQIEHSFDDQASYNIQMINLEKSGRKICVENSLDSITKEYVFYNTDYSLYKTITINLGPLFKTASYKSPVLNITYISEHLFDLVDDIDLMGEFSYYDNADELYAQVIVFHENGNTLFATDIDRSNAWLVSPSVQNSLITSSLMNTPEGTKMVLDVYYFVDGLYKYDVYSVPGSLISGVGTKKSGLLEENSLDVFPNPGSKFINLN